MSEIMDFLNAIPPVTKAILAPSVALPLVLRFYRELYEYVYFSPKDIFTKGQLWRLVSPFFVWQLGFSYIINMFFLYRHMKQLEEEEFRGRRADLIWMLVLLCVGILILGGIGHQVFLSEALLMSILYVWSRKFPDVNMTFMFGLRFKSQYLVWVLTIYHFILGAPIWQDVIGIVCGHIYWFCADVLPRTHDVNVVGAPMLLQRLVPNTGVAGVQYMNGQFEAHAPENPLRPNNAGGAQQEGQLFHRHNWGAGHRLGE